MSDTLTAAAETVDGWYAALGLTFGASADDVRRAYKRASLRYHPDRNRSDPEDVAKRRFQLVNSAYACLSDETRRREYDGVLRCRCALDQPDLTRAILSERPVVDRAYMYTVTASGGRRRAEESTLVVSFEEGIDAATLEQWRAGERVWCQPLSALSTVDEIDPAGGGGGTVRLVFAPSAAAAASTMTFGARSAADAASICALLHALLARAPLLARDDDAAMPPVARMSGWVQLVSAGKRSRAFALLGRSRLLLFADRACRSLQHLLTLEPGTLQVLHERDTAEVALDAGAHRLALVLESPFVASQWAQALTDSLLQKGLFLDAHTTTGTRASPTPAAPPGGPFAPPHADPFEAAQHARPAAAKVGRMGGAKAAVARVAGARATGARADATSSNVAEGDLLGDLGAEFAEPPRSRSLEEGLASLYSLPETEIDMSRGEPLDVGVAPADPAPAAASSSAGPGTGSDTGPIGPSAGRGGPSLLDEPIGECATPLSPQRAARGVTAPTHAERDEWLRELGASPADLGDLGDRELRIAKPTVPGVRLGLRLSSSDGEVTVLEVADGSAAQAAGLTPGQRVRRVGGVAVQSAAQASHLIAQAGATVPICGPSGSANSYCQLPISGGGEATGARTSAALTPGYTPAMGTMRGVVWSLPSWSIGMKCDWSPWRPSAAIDTPGAAAAADRVGKARGE